MCQGLKQFVCNHSSRLNKHIYTIFTSPRNYDGRWFASIKPFVDNTTIMWHVIFRHSIKQIDNGCVAPLRLACFPFSTFLPSEKRNVAFVEMIHVFCVFFFEFYFLIAKGKIKSTNVQVLCPPKQKKVQQKWKGIACTPSRGTHKSTLNFIVPIAS